MDSGVFCTSTRSVISAEAVRGMLEAKERKKAEKREKKERKRERKEGRSEKKKRRR